MRSEAPWTPVQARRARPIFLKYISDAFEEHHARLDAVRDQGAERLKDDRCWRD
jgi:hypothetical protein